MLVAIVGSIVPTVAFSSLSVIHKLDFETGEVTELGSFIPKDGLYELGSETGRFSARASQYIFLLFSSKVMLIVLHLLMKIKILLYFITLFYVCIDKI